MNAFRHKEHEPWFNSCSWKHNSMPDEDQSNGNAFTVSTFCLSLYLRGSRAHVGFCRTTGAPVTRVQRTGGGASLSGADSGGSGGAVHRAASRPGASQGTSVSHRRRDLPRFSHEGE